GMLKEKAEESVVGAIGKQYKKYNYTPPPIDLLKVYDKVEASQDELNASAQILEDVVSRFLKAQVKVLEIVPGPQVTRYELEVPSGVTVRSIETRAADIAYELAAVGGVRVQAPIPGKRAVGIEIPNKIKSIVGLREVVGSNTFIKHK
ncbi:MAG: DNA translocase FtsK, partial [Clostridia bacterium]|nr:DNA translocase FtsK [Clostridia bacterium]